MPPSFPGSSPPALAPPRRPSPRPPCALPGRPPRAPSLRAARPEEAPRPPGEVHAQRLHRIRAAICPAPRAAGLRTSGAAGAAPPSGAAAADVGSLIAGAARGLPAERRSPALEGPRAERSAPALHRPTLRVDTQRTCARRGASRPPASRQGGRRSSGRRGRTTRARARGSARPLRPPRVPRRARRAPTRGDAAVSRPHVRAPAASPGQIPSAQAPSERVPSAARRGTGRTFREAGGAAVERAGPTRRGAASLGGGPGAKTRADARRSRRSRRVARRNVRRKSERGSEEGRTAPHARRPARDPVGPRWRPRPGGAAGDQVARSDRGAEPRGVRDRFAGVEMRGKEWMRRRRCSSATRGGPEAQRVAGPGKRMAAQKRSWREARLRVPRAAVFAGGRGLARGVEGGGGRSKSKRNSSTHARTSLQWPSPVDGEGVREMGREGGKEGGPGAGGRTKWRKKSRQNELLRSGGGRGKWGAADANVLGAGVAGQLWAAGQESGRCTSKRNEMGWLAPNKGQQKKKTRANVGCAS